MPHMLGCNNKHAMSGCKTHGVRLCLWTCMNRHLRGEGNLKRLCKEIQWKEGEWYD